MRTLLVFIVIIGSALAGVRELSPAEETEIIDLYNRLCGRGDPKDPVEVNRRWVYCKTGPTRRPTYQEHERKLEVPTPKPITVLINRPPTEHRHKITVTGEHPGQDTKIYVLPQEDTHQVDVNANVVSKKQKPTVYYIKDQQTVSSSAPTYQTNSGYQPQGQYNQQYGQNQNYEYSGSEQVPAAVAAPHAFVDAFGAPTAALEGQEGAPFTMA